MFALITAPMMPAWSQELRPAIQPSTAATTVTGPHLHHPAHQYRPFKPEEPLPPMLAPAAPDASDVPDPNETPEAGEVHIAGPGEIKLPVNLQTGLTYSHQSKDLVLVPLLVVKVSETPEETNPFNAYKDQPVVARTTSPLIVTPGTVVPTGTVFRGKVVRVLPPKILGREGYAVIDFQTLVTTTGEVIPIRAEGTPPHNGKEIKLMAAQAIARNFFAGASVGAMTGVAAGLLFMAANPSTIIADLVLPIGAGIAVGGAIGVAVGVLLKGPAAQSVMDRSAVIALPKEVLERASVPWTSIEIADAPVRFVIVKTKGLARPYRMRIDAVVKNDSSETLDSSDLVLENEHGDTFPAEQDPKANLPNLFRVAPHTVRHFVVDFSPGRPHSGFRLCWYRHPLRTERLVDFPLP